jgi:urease accessory protein
MRARTGVVADAGPPGDVRLSRLRSAPPLVLRPTAEALYLVGGAAGPLGGDKVSLEVVVGPGAALTVRSAAASVALPGRPGAGESVVEVAARVAAGGLLRWEPEPTVVARGCRHRIDARIRVDAGGRLLWREELLLGRHGEPAGSVVTRLSVDAGERALLRQELALGAEHPHAGSPAVGGGARAAGSVTAVGFSFAEGVPRAAPAADGWGGWAAVLDLPGPGVQVTALADDRRSLARLLDAGLAAACPEFR